jgi:pimeloyl-ACP methyl ester carboxylesterase
MHRIAVFRSHPRLGPRALVALVCITSFGFISTSRAIGQDTDTGAAKKKGPEALEKEPVVLETKDGLQLECDYYPSWRAEEKEGNGGKDVIPIIMLHAWKGSRADFAKLAWDLHGLDYGSGNSLQKRGHAVIVPDLRGHGKSTVIKMGQESRTIDQSLMKKSDFDAMVLQDLEAVKKFLIEKNNEGKLNIEKLCVVGADMGALMAMDWTVHDWAAPRLLTGKQGQDVKAMVLISPPMNFKGLSSGAALNAFAGPPLSTDVSVLVIGGQEKGGRAWEDAQRIFKKIGQTRPKPPTDPDQAAQSQDFFLDGLKTSLQGTKILDDRRLEAQVAYDIGQFIELRLMAKKFPWAMRKSALGGE